MWTVTNTVSVTSPGSQSGHVGSAVTPVPVTGSDSSTTTTLAFSATGLPAGLSISAAGTISGTPTRAGVYPVTVTAVDGAGFTGTAAFTWSVVGPVITSLSVSSGPASGGTKVSVLGTGLAGATSVTFGGSPATGVTVNRTGTKLTAVAPAHVAGTVDVVVTTVSGPTLAAPVDRFTYTPPTVISITPATGPPAGGKPVKIRGSALKGATVVSFGSVGVTTFTVNGKGTSITVHAPRAPPGPSTSG